MEPELPTAAPEIMTEDTETPAGETTPQEPPTIIDESDSNSIPQAFAIQDCNIVEDSGDASAPTEDLDPFRADAEESNPTPNTSLIEDTPPDKSKDDSLVNGDAEKSLEVEIITADKSLPEGVIIQAPEEQEDVCIIESEDPPRSVAQEEGADHSYTRPPSDGSSEPITSAESTLKVVYPKRRAAKGAARIIVYFVPPILRSCGQCAKLAPCTFKVFADSKDTFLCNDVCMKSFYETTEAVFLRASSPSLDLTTVIIRACSECSKDLSNVDTQLSWETMEFCDEDCLEKYQTKTITNCSQCGSLLSRSLIGKYSVCFGYKIQSFCLVSCLEEFKKGLKRCTYCQKDISQVQDGFLAPVGEAGQFKDFCSEDCMNQYDALSRNAKKEIEICPCDVCQKEKIIQLEVITNAKTFKLCSEVCFATFKFVNPLNNIGQCKICKRLYSHVNDVNAVIFEGKEVKCFCTRTCWNIYVLSRRRIIQCNWCKVKKYNYDMITKSNQTIVACTIKCLALYQVSLTAFNKKEIACDHCGYKEQPLYHLTMSDATIRSFCTYPCVMSFQNKFKKCIKLANSKDPRPTGQPKKIIRKNDDAAPDVVSLVPSSTASVVVTSSPTQPVSVISSLRSLAPKGSAPAPTSTTVSSPSSVQSVTLSNTQMKNLVSKMKTTLKQQILIKPPAPTRMMNVCTMTRPRTVDRGCSPIAELTNSEEKEKQPSALIPVPVPIYIPAPMCMYNAPAPIPLPIPIPVAVPVFIPTTQTTAKAIMEDMKRIQEKTPADPLEAELLMMAEMVAEEKKDDQPPPVEEPEKEAPPEPPAEAASNFSPVEMEDDIFRTLMGTDDLGDSQEDLDSGLSSTSLSTGLSTDRKRPRDQPKSPPSATMKKARCDDNPVISVQKPDTDMSLKYTFGVNAWKHWVHSKNAELEKSDGETLAKVKLFKTEILQLTAEELNFGLTTFVKEVRKPSGQEYTVDTVFYLCLGIQYYLSLNGRVDNIFFDTYYETFTAAFDELTAPFVNIGRDAQHFTTRIEESHLWESGQLGAHIPFIILNTLLLFNTKFCKLSTVEEHSQLSFVNFVKHEKKTFGAQGERKSTVLRLFTPSSLMKMDPTRKEVYEMEPNTEDRLNCPVRMFDFYLSRCPENVKSRSDVFYLLPERSCIPDSPVWFSSTPVPQNILSQMLNRLKMVKEVSIGLHSK